MPSSEKHAQVGPKAGPTSDFYSCIPTRMHGPNLHILGQPNTFLASAPGKEDREPQEGCGVRGKGALFLCSVKVTGLAQKLGQLEAINRDLQSKSWANLQVLGQPCNFRA